MPRIFHFNRCFQVFFCLRSFYILLAFLLLSFLWRHLVLQKQIPVLSILINSTDENIMTACSLQESIDNIRDICQDFRMKKVYGSLCHPLCNGEIRIVKCLGHAVKENVLVAIWESRNIILKSHKSQLSFKPDYFKVTSFLNAILQFSQFISDSYFGVDSTSIFNLSKYIVSYYDLAPKGVLHKNEVDQISYFIDQSENFKTFFLNDTGIMPEYFGNCGALWATAYLKNSRMLWELSHPFSKPIPWKFQARIAVGFLDLVKKLEIVPFGPLHLCDIQMPNFGLYFFNNYPIVQVIDTDVAFFNSYLLNSIKMGQTCSSDYDCSIFNCHIKCDLEYKQCYPKILSNNFLNICRSILRRYILIDPPSSKSQKLKGLLDACSRSNQGEGLSQNEYYQDLYLMLVEEAKFKFDPNIDIAI